MMTHPFDLLSTLAYIGPGAGMSFWGQALFVAGFVALIILVLRSKGGG